MRALDELSGHGMRCRGCATSIRRYAYQISATSPLFADRKISQNMRRPCGRRDCLSSWDRRLPTARGLLTTSESAAELRVTQGFAAVPCGDSRHRGCCTEFQVSISHRPRHLAAVTAFQSFRRIVGSTDQCAAVTQPVSLERLPLNFHHSTHINSAKTQRPIGDYLPISL